jgi:hypothetical protein
MKFKHFFILLLTLLSFSLFSQKGLFEYGWSISPALTFAQKKEQPPAMGFSTGPYAHFQFSKRIGIGSAVAWQQLQINTLEYGRCESDPWDLDFFLSICEAPARHEFQIVQVPVWMSLNLDFHAEAKWKMNFIAGYTYGKLLQARQKEADYRLHGLVDDIHFGTVGLECKRKVLKEKYVLTLGSHFEVTNIYDQQYGELNTLKAVFRIGRIGR